MFPNDESLLLQFRNGSTSDFNELFARYQQPLFRFFFRRLLDRAQAEDLTQETFLALLRNSDRYEPRSSVRSYLFAIAFRILSAHARHRGRHPVACLPRQDPSEDEIPDESLWVRQGLERLTELEREILMLREYEQLSYQEIAQLLALPVNTVRSKLFRARFALKQVLDPALDMSTPEGHPPCR